MSSACNMRGALRPQVVAGRSRSVAVRAQAPEQVSSRRSLLAGTIAIGLASMVSSAQATTFLKSTGARGLLSDEEEQLVQLRLKSEQEAWRMIEEEESILQREVSTSQEGGRKFCATPFGVDVVGITEAIALIGALVGGLSAAKRKDEVDRLNEQLRKINMQLRQQARAGTIYAPGLTYAPSNDAGIASVLKPPPSAPASTEPVAMPTPTKLPSLGPMLSVSMEEEEMSPDQLACREALRTGKRLLKERSGAASMVRFEKALMLSKALGDKVQERRACRGLAAASRLQGQYTSAIKQLERVLDISREMREFTGDADAYGTIADCYTDMGEFEKAAKFYDRYIAAMNGEPAVV